MSKKEEKLQFLTLLCPHTIKIVQGHKERGANLHIELQGFLKNQSIRPK